MIVVIGGYKYGQYKSCDVVLKYSGITDVFQFELFYDPTIPEHRENFKPCQYPPCQILDDDNQLLITGIITGHTFNNPAAPTLITIRGVSKTGILENSCSANVGRYTNGFGRFGADNVTTFSQNAAMQLDGHTLYEIATTLCRPYGIRVICDETAKQECEVDIFATTTINPDEFIGSYLAKLALQKHVILSHDRHGNLLLTKTKTTEIKKATTTTLQPVPTQQLDTLPAFIGNDKVVDNTTTTKTDIHSIHHFTDGDHLMTNLTLNVDGERMNSVIHVVNQNGDDDTIANPYCKTLKIKRFIQQSQSENTIDVAKTARNILGEDLKAITLSIEIEGWRVNKSIVRPNQIVTVTSPENALNNTNRWFINQVRFIETFEIKTATLSCLLPECFNNETVINVFD